MEPRRPLVGVSAGEHDATWGTWQAPALLLTATYLRAIESAGGIPVVLPPLQAPVSNEDAMRTAAQLVRSLDALVLSGGADVEPSRYGCEPHERTRTAAVRDRMEIALVQAAEDRHLPMLAICRGVQVLNVVRGGTLHQHLPDLVGSSDHAPVSGGFGRHRVRISENGPLASALTATLSDSEDRRIEVPTNHHQAVADVGRGLVACAWADDGTIEAVEDPDAAFCVGVQWHPEAGEDDSLFRALVQAALPR